ncbi:MAG: hypothetical protein IPG09_18425 [Ignavibacteria bacterium]|nr:hypothetical protein [Ignavibacteria bacterium]
MIEEFQTEEFSCAIDPSQIRHKKRRAFTDKRNVPLTRVCFQDKHYNPIGAMEFLLDKMRGTKSNKEFSRQRIHSHYFDFILNSYEEVNNLLIQ